MSPNESICQTCFYFKCPWHIAFEPTPGWTATPTVIKNFTKPYDSYCVTKCPYYKSRDWDYVPVTKLAQIIGHSDRYIRNRAEDGRLRADLLEQGYILKVDKSQKHYKYFIRRIKYGEQ